MQWHDKYRARLYDHNDRHDYSGHHDHHDRRDRNDHYECSNHACDKHSRKHDHYGERNGKHRGHATKDDDCHCKDKTHQHIMHNDDGFGCSCSASCGHSHSTPHGSSSRSCSAFSSRSVENHHTDDPVNASHCHTKRAHLYSNDDDGSQHLLVQDSGSIYMTFAAPSKKSKKSRHKVA